MITTIVTGSSGFIGFNVAKALLKKGHKVIGIDNENADYDPKIKIARSTELKKNHNFEFVKADIANNDIFKKIKIKEVKYFVHLAARDFYYDDPFNVIYRDYLETNVLGTANMFELAHKLKVKKFVFASTHSVYGKTKKGILTEKKIVPNPISPHGASKLAAEEVVRFMSSYHNLPAVALRIFTVYGEGMVPHTFIPQAVQAIKNNQPLRAFNNFSKTTRDFIYIDDVVNFIVSSLNKRLSYQAINIATGKSIGIEKVLATISKKLGRKPKVEKNKKYSLEKIVVDRVQADISRAKKILRYTPRVNFEEGIKKTVEYFIKKNQS